MAMDYVRGGSARCPSLLVGSLLVICLFLVCSWWSLSSQNFVLLSQVHNLEDQLKLNGAELDNCREKSEGLLGKAASAQVKVDQLKTEEDLLRDSLAQAQDELNLVKKKVATLESSLTFKNTELESLKALGEAKNKTLEALRTEKKTLNARLNEEEAKVSVLREEIAALKAKKLSVGDIVLGQYKKSNPQDAGISLNGDHAEAAAQDENNAAENKAEGVVPETDNKEGEVLDDRERAMANTGS